MEVAERRKTERVMLAIPIRVLAFGSSCGDFTEETETVQVNRAGARIVLKHRVTPGDTIRIVNLQNFREADFRVVGAACLEPGRAAEWGIEYSEFERNIWGIEFPAPLDDDNHQAGALLVCRQCGSEALAPLTLVEVDILETCGLIQRLCSRCRQFCPWTYADVERRPKHLPPAAVFPPGPARAGPRQGGVERRAHKRLPLKLPVRVRDHRGEQEIAKTEDVSKGGFAVCLSMRLKVGEIVGVNCPYTEGDQTPEQKAEVRRQAVFTPGERWLYGLRYIR
jgi:hypothetical protein